MTPLPLVALRRIQLASHEDEETTPTMEVKEEIQVDIGMDTETPYYSDNYSAPSSPCSRVQCEVDSQGDGAGYVIKRRKLDSIPANKKSFDLPSNGHCPYCRGRFPHKNVLQTHMFHYHCHHFFPNHKLQSVTVEQFRKILAELLFQDLIKGKTSCIYCAKNFPVPKTGREMSLVKKHYVDCHFQDLEKKLLTIQEDPNLSERLVEASNCNPNGKFCECGVYLPTILRQMHHHKSYCTLGKKKVSIDSLMPVASSCSEDKKEETSEHLSSHGKSQAKGGQPKSKSFPCAFCRGKFNQKNSLKCHMIKCHCETFFPNHKLDSITDLEFQKILVDLLFKNAIEGGKCPYCNNVQKNSILYKPHMISYHYEELEKKLIEIQNNPNLSTTLTSANPVGRVCKLCGIYLESVNSQVTHDKFYCTKSTNLVSIARTPTPRAEDEDLDFMTKFDSVPSNPKQISCKLCGKVMKRHRQNAKNHWNWFCVHGKRLKREKPKSKRSKYSRSCPYCRYECNSDEHVGIVLKHLARFHPEHFFLQERAKEFSMVPLYVFQRVLVDIVFPECFQKVGPSISCRLCELNFLRDHESKIHLLQHHKKELMERFQVVVKDPNLEERLKGNPHAMSCPCGMYLPNGGNPSNKQRQYHEKNQCKLQSGASSEPISQKEIVYGQV